MKLVTIEANNSKKKQLKNQYNLNAVMLLIPIDKEHCQMLYYVLEIINAIFDYLQHLVLFKVNAQQ